MKTETLKHRQNNCNQTNVFGLKPMAGDLNQYKTGKTERALKSLLCLRFVAF